jgi:threonine synthase
LKFEDFLIEIYLMAETFTLTCTTCQTQLPDGEFAYLCPACAEKQLSGEPPRGILRTTYSWQNILEKYSTGNLFEKLADNAFTDILPIKKKESLGNLKVGLTPIYRFETETAKGRVSYFLKDDSQNPTFSFKDRASQLVSAYALEQGISTLVAASTGNAGSSLAGICASQKQKAVIMVPKTAPAAKLLQIIMYGALPVLVDGNYDAAFDLSVKASEHFGWFNRNTAFNPFTIEGKKSVSLEIYSQLNGQLPLRIFVPVGDGVILAGVYKGFEDLLNLGIINRMPVIVAVQSSSSDNLIRNIKNEVFAMRPATTRADSISVDYPRNYFMARDFLLKYKGEWITVTDDQILEASFRLSRETGIFAEPAAAAAMAGFLAYSEKPDIEQDAQMMVLSTGSGLKDIQTPLQHIRLPQPIKPSPDELMKYISEYAQT